MDKLIDKKYITYQEKSIKHSLCSKRCRELKGKATTSELLFREILEKNNIKFQFQKGFIAGNNFCIADFYLPKPKKIVIEIDGKYHENKSQINRDKNKDEYYKRRGFKVIHIENDKIIDFDISILK
jgi:very-short-patch-repair endonuclease